MRQIGAIGLFVCFTCSVSAQETGEAVFGEDKVFTVQLFFDQPGFWDSLLLNYYTDTYMLADVVISDNAEVIAIDSIGIRLKGNSSFTYPGTKKSFKIDFNKYVDEGNYHGLKKLNFNNAFHDPTFMHEKIVLDICDEMHIPAPRANYADVYMNGIHWGFYIVVEQVDDLFLGRQFNEDSGNLFKAGDAFGGSSGVANLVWYGYDPELYYNRYELKTNEAENDWSDLISLIDFINNSSDAEFADALSGNVNLPSLLSSLAIDNLFANLDAYIYSGRNYYLYHKSDDNLWQYIKWDCNEMFGAYKAGLGDEDLTQLPIQFTAMSRPLAKRIFNIPSLSLQYQVALCEIYQSAFTVESIDARIDSLYTLIQPYVYADNNKMYSNAQFEENLDSDIAIENPGGTQILYGLRSFVQSRRNAVDTQINCFTVDVENTAGPIENCVLYPNPASEYLQVLPAFGPFTFEIFDVYGKCCMQGVCNSSVIDIRHLPPGVFFCVWSRVQGFSLSNCN